MDKEHNEIEVVYIGDTVKATKTADGLLVGGYLVRFTSDQEPDLENDFFTAETDYDIDEYPTTKSVYFHHGMNEHVGLKKLGRAKLTKDEVGIFAETLLKERDEYEAFIADLIEQGKIGWSSATASHLVQRKSMDNGTSWIASWPIAEASLTHTPAEFRNSVQPIKSLITDRTPEASGDDAVKASDNTEQIKSNQKEVEIMELELEQIQKMIDDASMKAVEEYRKSEPATKAASVVVTTDEGDRPWKSTGEFLQAVKNAALYPSNQDKRLFSLKASGMNETTPADGGYLVPQNTAAGIIERMYNMGKILGRVAKDTISGQNMTYNAVDESSRATTRHGGVLGYWLAEAATKTGSKPQFRQVELKLKKVAAVAYATDELLSDVTALESWINRTVPDELVFMAEDAIYNGDGNGKPLGFMQSPALVSPLRTDATKVQLADILSMWSRRWAGVDDYVWLINQDVYPQLFQLGSTYQNLFMPAGFAGNPVSTLLGKPIIENEYSATLGTTGDIVLAALSQYQAIDKGVESASSIHVQFLTDETTFRFVYRIDGAPMWSAPLTPFKGSNTQSPFVALATASS